MADKTHIEWTDATWNPITGCSVVSPGCANCYAMKLAGGRLKNVASRKGLTQDTKAGPVWTGEVRFNEDAINWPLSWKGSKESRQEGRRSRIFVCAHGDLFHESVPDAWIDRVFAVMALSPNHDFQVLTKRADRMRDYITRMSSAFGGPAEKRRVTDAVNEALMRSGRNWGYCGSTSTSITTISQPLGAREPYMLRRLPDGGVERLVAWTPQERWTRLDDNFAATLGVLQVHSSDFGWGLKQWPLPNVWLGVSAEDQARADERIPDLLATPAAVRWLSAEPLLGSLDVAWVLSRNRLDIAQGFLRRGHFSPGLETLRRLDWIVAGGESGPGARPMHPDWARDLRDQCAAAGVPFLFKQWGAWAPGENIGPGHPSLTGASLSSDGTWSRESWTRRAFEGLHIDDEPDVWLASKKTTGRLLDGVLHDAYPEVPR